MGASESERGLETDVWRSLRIGQDFLNGGEGLGGDGTTLLAPRGGLLVAGFDEGFAENG